MCIYIVLRQAGARNHGEFILVRHEEGLMRSAIYKQGCVSGLGHSVRQWVKRAGEGAGDDRARRQRRRPAGEGQGPGRLLFFSPPCTGVHAAGARRGGLFLPGQARRQAPAGAMPPCVWRWHTRPGGGPAAPTPVWPSPSRRPGPGKGQPPSVRRRSIRPSGGGPQHSPHMHAHNTSPRHKENNNTKTTNPSLSSLSLLSLSSSPLALALPLSLSHHILLYCPPLSWKPTQVNPSLARPPVACLV